MTMPPPAVKPGAVAAVLIPPATPSAPPLEPAIAAIKPPDVKLPIAPAAPQVRAPASEATQKSEVPTPSSANDAAQKQIEQDARQRTIDQSRLEQEKQSAERLRQAEMMANAQREAARREGERLELARQEGLRREALEQERTRQGEQAQQEAARQQLERTEAARLEAARREAARQEQARQAQQEAARKDALKQDEAKQDAARLEAKRQDASKQEAARQQRAKHEQAQRERAEEEAKREERLRAIGKQLDAEAAQRDPSRALLPTVSSLRRGWLFGRADPNGDIVLYAEAMSQKIEMNMTFDMVREVVKQRHARPIVTVAIRADGSVEKVTFEVSSGVPAIDDAIRKVVASQAPYAAFPPNLARQYDVIEIRRTWVFDTAIRLQ